jgi:hypothetical protein
MILYDVATYMPRLAFEKADLNRIREKVHAAMGRAMIP